MRKKKDWGQMETNCQKIVSYVAEHPMQGLNCYDISRELNIPQQTVDYLIRSGKCEQVGTVYGYKVKSFMKKRTNVIEAVYWGIYEMQKERVVNQDDNFG